jgi:hypothetical protein
MNKKYLQYSVLMMLLMIYKPSYAMYGAMFNVARFVGVTTLPVFGSYTAYNRHKDNQKKLKELKPVTENAVKDWFTEEKKKLNMLNVESVSLFEDQAWASGSYGKTGYITAPSNNIIKLNEALTNKSVNNETIAAQDNSEIARNAMLLKHELAHIINKDFQNGTYALVAIPLVVEALSFGTTSVFRKLCNIEEPKTLIKTMLRSSAALGSIVPKSLLSAALLIPFWRYREKRCDKFACEHAESRLELEEFAKWHKKNESPYATGNRRDIRFAEFEKDPVHPAPVDRKEMVEAYIAKWDAAHTQL